MNSSVFLPEWVLVAAVRHALGQQAMIVSDVVELIEERLPYLSIETRKRLVREIDYVLPGAKVDSPLTGYYHDQWRYIRALIARSLGGGESSS